MSNRGPGLVLLAAIASLTGCRQEAGPPELPPRAIQWERVAATVGDERRVVSGIVTAIDDTRLAFDVSGTVLSVDVSLGDLVEKDQPLAGLDPEPFDLAVLGADASLSEAKAQLELATVTLERVQRAMEAGAARPRELDVATAERNLWDSQVAAAQARLGLAQRDRRRSVLVAPFAGKISVRQIDPAMKISVGQTVFEMDSESGLRVEVQMPETLISRLRQGDAVEIAFPSVAGAEGRTYRGVVSEIGTRAGTGNAFPVRADLLEPPPTLRPGMTAEVAFSLSRDEKGLADLEGFMIPIAAAYAEANDQFSVFVFDASTSTVARRSVRTGGVRDNAIAVLEGLAEGDVIATAGVAFLHDGQTVTLLEGERR